MRCYACKGHFDICFRNVDLVEHSLLIVAIVGLADDHFDLLVLILCIVQLDDLVTAQGVYLIVYDGEVSIGNIVELTVFLHSEVFTGLLNLSQDLLCLCG